MRDGLRAEITKLTGIAGKRGAAAAPVPAAEVVVADWVRFKCRFGCKGYGKHLSCPPYAPTPAETRQMVRGYRWGLLLRFDGDPAHPDLAPDQIPDDFHSFFRDLIVWVNGTVHALEKTAFYDGFYKAFGFGAYPCIYCETCVPEERDDLLNESVRRFCRYPDLMRPSMEAAGMDVFATAKCVGWDLRTVPCEGMVYGKIVHGDLRSVGLVLIE